MPTEVLVLALAILLQALQFVAMSITANRQLGPRRTAGPRDEPLAPLLTGTAGRLYRALNNHFEGLVLFTAAVIVVTLADASTPFTRACAWAYLIARIAYVPAYVSGILYVRSAIWMIGFVATIGMVLATLANIK